MRHKGILSNWIDDKGFGFISPRAGGEPVFVHIKDFQQRQHRPAVHQRLTYELGYDGQGRPRAERVAISGKSLLAMFSTGQGFLLLSAGGLAVAVSLVVLLPESAALALICQYAAASLMSFIAYAIDKRAAQLNQQRLPENTLHLLSLTGGWPGALLAQKTLRHKSIKTSFQWLFWLTVAVNGLAIAGLLSLVI